MTTTSTRRRETPRGGAGRVPGNRRGRPGGASPEGWGCRRLAEASCGAREGGQRAGLRPPGLQAAPRLAWGRTRKRKDPKEVRQTTAQCSRTAPNLPGKGWAVRVGEERPHSWGWQTPGLGVSSTSSSSPRLWAPPASPARPSHPCVCAAERCGESCWRGES